MNKFLLFVTVLLVNVAVAGAQTEKRIYTKVEQSSAQEHKFQKRMEIIQDSINYVNAVNALENLDFVLEADRLILKRGEMVFVTSNLNFISLSDDKAVIQVAPFNGGGPNGVGGITLEGRASNIQMKTDKKGNINLSMSVMGTGLSATLGISLSKGANRASVTVSPNFNFSKITLNGVLLPSECSQIFKGRAL